jgi:hypothetical protein
MGEGLRNPNRITITKVVATVHCEQKSVFDERIGDRSPISVRLKAAQGTEEHLRFEREAGQPRKIRDSRCYIASHVFGIDAVQTHFLRSWRDNCLQPFAFGWLVIKIYYAISPGLVRGLGGSKRMSKLVRRGLAALLERGCFDHVSRS